MAYLLPQSIYDSYGGKLESRVAAYMKAVADFPKTVNIPAPIEDAIVVAIAQVGGMASVQIVPNPVPEPAPPLPVLPPRPAFVVLLLPAEPDPEPAEPPADVVDVALVAAAGAGVDESSDEQAERATKAPAQNV